MHVQHVFMQQATLLASMMDLGVAFPGVNALWRAAADEEQREAKFGQLSAVFV
jgi:hypothetical protein